MKLFLKQYSCPCTTCVGLQLPLLAGPSAYKIPSDIISAEKYSQSPKLDVESLSQSLRPARNDLPNVKFNESRFPQHADEIDIR